MEERVDWFEEATGVINDVKSFVNQMFITTKLTLPIGESGIFINVESREQNKYTILLCINGFKVVSNEFDKYDETIDNENQFFETPYSLLQSISPSYNNQFGRLLAEKLEKL